jgi:hypothetical protein
MNKKRLIKGRRHLMLTKEISEVEKGCRKWLEIQGKFCGELQDKYTGLTLCPTCQAKLSTLKSAQAKFDKFVEDLKEQLGEMWAMGEGSVGDIWNKIDELSSKQEETC